MRRIARLCVMAFLATALLSGGHSATAAPEFEATLVRYALLTLAEPGGRVLFYFEAKNSGAAAWTPGSVMLTNVKNSMGGPAQLSISRNVLPNETFYWDFEVSAPRLPGVHESVWEIRRGGTAISPRLVCYVIAVPKEAQELRAKIKRLIDDFNREHGHEVEQIVRLVRDLIQREGGDLIQRLIQSRCGLLPGMLAAVAIAAALRRNMAE